MKEIFERIKKENEHLSNFTISPVVRNNRFSDKISLSGPASEYILTATIYHSDFGIIKQGLYLNVSIGVAGIGPHRINNAHELETEITSQFLNFDIFIRDFKLSLKSHFSGASLDGESKLTAQKLPE